MNQKGRDTLMAVVGLYLGYMGYNLIRDAFADKPDNYIVFVLFGIFFIAVGLAVVVIRGKSLLPRPSADAQYNQEVGDEAEDEMEVLESTVDQAVGETVVREMEEDKE